MSLLRRAVEYVPTGKDNETKVQKRERRRLLVNMLPRRPTHSARYSSAFPSPGLKRTPIGRGRNDSSVLGPPDQGIPLPAGGAAMSDSDSDSTGINRKFFDYTLRPGEFMYKGPDLRVGDLVRYNHSYPPMEGHIVRIERMSDGATFEHPKCLIGLGNGRDSLILAEDLVLVERRPEIFDWEENEEEEDDDML